MTAVPHALPPPSSPLNPPHDFCEDITMTEDGVLLDWTPPKSNRCKTYFSDPAHCLTIFGISTVVLWVLFGATYAFPDEDMRALRWTLFGFALATSFGACGSCCTACIVAARHVVTIKSG